MTTFAMFLPVLLLVEVFGAPVVGRAGRVVVLLVEPVGGGGGVGIPVVPVVWTGSVGTRKVPVVVGKVVVVVNSCG